jgi:putative transposase
MTDHGVSCSKSWSGNVWDNPAKESLFSPIEAELIGKKVYRTKAQAKSDVFAYVECFSNRAWRYSTLGYLSTIDFGREAGAA